MDELGGAELEPEPEAIGPELELELEPIGAIDPERIVTSRRLDGQDVPGGSWTSLEMLIGRAKVYEQANKRTSKQANTNIRHAFNNMASAHHREHVLKARCVRKSVLQIYKYLGHDRS